MYDVAKLVGPVRKNDTLAMKVLYENAAAAMLTLSLRITGDHALSEDILQESMLTSFQKIKSLTEPGKYYSWLKRIVVNNSIQAVRKVRTYENLEQVEVVHETEESTEWFLKIPLEKVKDEIEVLPDGCREVFTLYLLEGYKHREIAEMLGLSLSSSKSQYQYARKLLKKRLLVYKER